MVNSRLEIVVRENISNMSRFPVSPCKYTAEGFTLAHADVLPILLYNGLYIGLKDILRAKCQDALAMGDIVVLPTVAILHIDFACAIESPLLTAKIFHKHQCQISSYKKEGFTWQDDYTQHVIGQELSNIHKVHSRRPDIFASEASDPGRILEQNEDNERKSNLENEVNLAESLQQYLKYLGLLSRSAATSLPTNLSKDRRPESIPLLQKTLSYVYNDPVRYYLMQKPKERAAPLAHTSTSHQQYVENLHGMTSNQPQPDKYSMESEAGLDQKALMAALHTYITQNLSAQSNDKSSHSRTKGSHIYADRFYSSQVIPFDGSFSRGKAEDFKTNKPFQPQSAVGALGPAPVMLNQKSASQNDPKDPLRVVDGKVGTYLFYLF
ncbi:UNVERIFIED_CONTAM: hypothetical protein H355_009680 [Colinus virginianus]|nr:hypothetical protein H355_009680 [Colinus virginianus]